MQMVDINPDLQPSSTKTFAKASVFKSRYGGQSLQPATCNSAFCGTGSATCNL